MIKKLSMSDYRKSEGLNISSLVNIQKSPKHFQWCKDHPKDTESMILGRAIHTLILEPTLFEKEYSVAPACDRRTTKGKAIWEEFVASSQVKEVLKAEQYETAKQAAASVLSSKEIQVMLSKGQSELSLYHTINGTESKGRLDFLAENFFLDVKTCQNCTAKDFGRDFVNYDYHVKLAYYQYLVKLETGLNLPCIVLAVETTDEMDFQVYQIDQDFLDIGLEIYFELLETYQKCLTENKWPGVSKKVRVMTAPDWLIAQRLKLKK